MLSLFLFELLVVLFFLDCGVVLGVLVLVLVFFNVSYRCFLVLSFVGSCSICGLLIVDVL